MRTKDSQPQKRNRVNIDIPGRYVGFEQEGLAVGIYTKSGWSRKHYIQLISLDFPTDTRRMQNPKLLLNIFTLDSFQTDCIFSQQND